MRSRSLPEYPDRPRRGPYRGWWVLGGGFLTTMLVTGLTFYSVGLYLVPITREFGLSRAEANNGVIAFVLGTALWGPIIGRIIDRVSARAVVAAGGLMFAAAFVMISLSRELWLIGLAALGPLGFSLQSAGALVASAVASRWFARRRGRAMGVIASASAIGGVVFLPINAWLIEVFGWRVMFAVVGVVAGVIILAVAFFVMRSRPDEGELRSAGESDAGQTPESAAARVISIRELFFSPRFWLVVLGLGFIGCTVQAVLATIPSFLNDNGFELQAAGFVVSIFTAAIVAGKIVTGYLTESISVRWLVIATSVLQAICYIILTFELLSAFLIVILVVLGLGVGAFQPLLTMGLVGHFGPASLGSAMGGASPILQLMAIGALRIAGVTYDQSGSYDITFIAFAAALTLGALLFVLAKPPAIAPLTPVSEPA